MSDLYPALWEVGFPCQLQYYLKRTMLSSRQRAELRELRSRGIRMSAREWAKKSYNERQDILKQSRRRARETRYRARPAAERRALARRRARYRARLPRRRLTPDQQDDEARFWEEYMQAVAV